MANVQQITRDYLLRARSDGVAQVTADAEKLGAATDSLAVKTETQSKSSLSAAAALERHQRSLDLAYRSAQQFAKVQQDLDRAQQQGLVTAARYAELSALNANRHNILTKAANDNSAATGLNTAQFAELGHAAKAAFEQVAAGAPIMRVLAQQGASTAQALSLGQGGVGGSLRAIGAGALAFLGPLGLVAAGFLAVEVAALAMFALLKKEAPTAERLLAEHDRLLRVIKDSYDSVSQSAKFWIDQGKDATRLQLLQQEVDLRQKLVEATAKALKPTVQLDLFTHEADVFEKYKPFRDAIANLNEGWQRGAPDVRAYVDEVARIGLANPILQKLGVELINNVNDATKFANSLKQIREALGLLDGNKPTEEGRKTLGLPEAPKGQRDPFESQINQINKHTATVLADTAAVGASVGEHARLRSEAQLLEVVTRNGATATATQTARIKEASDAAGVAAQKFAEKSAQSQADFALETVLLSDTEKQVAAINFQLHGDKWKDYGDSALSNTVRITAGINQLNQATTQFGTNLLSGLLRGDDIIKSLTSSASTLVQTLASKNLENFLKSGSLFGTQNLNSAQGAVGVAGAGLAGYQSGNPLTGALGGAAAGATFGPAGAAIGGIAGLIGGIIGADSKSRQQLQQAQEEWRRAGPAFQTFLKQMTGGVQGNVSQAIQQASATWADLEDKAWKARDTAAIEAGRAALQKFSDTQKMLFQSTFAATVQGLNDGLGPDSPFMKAVDGVKSALHTQLAFIDDVDVAIGDNIPGTMARAKAASQTYLLALLQQPPALSAVQTSLMQIHGTANALQGALVQLGLSSADAAKAINDGVTKAMASLKTQFEAGLTERLNTATGQGFLTDATKLIAQHQQDILDAVSLGTDPSLVAATFKAEAQKIVDGAELAGDAFKDFNKQFPALQGVVHEFTQSAVDDSKALQDAINGRAKSIVDFVADLRAGPNTTLSPLDRRSAAKSIYDTDLALAQSNDQGAQARITQDAQNYLDAERAISASSVAFQNVFSGVTSQLLALPDVQNTTDPSVQALRDLLTAINAGNAAQATNATLASLLTKDQLATLGLSKDTTVGLLLTKEQLDTIGIATNARVDQLLTASQLAEQGLAKNAIVQGLLTADQVNALGLSKDSTSGNLLTKAQLDLLGLATDTKVGTLLTPAQLTAAHLASDTTVGTLLTQAQLSSMQLAKDANLSAVATNTNNTTGYLVNGIAPGLSAVAANTNNTTGYLVNGIGTRIDSTNSLTGTGNETLDAIRGIQTTGNAQLTLLTAALSPTVVSVQVTPSGNIPAPGTSEPHVGSNYLLQNQVVTALNKIAWNTYVITQNTAYLDNGNLRGHGGVGTYAAGGWVTGGTPGVDSVRILAQQKEYVVNPYATEALTRQYGAGIMDIINAGRLPDFNATGRLPFNDNLRTPVYSAPNIVPFRGGNNDGSNAALLAEMREMNKKIERLEKIIAAGDNMNARATIEAGEKGANASKESGRAIRDEIRMRRRDQRAANG